MAFLAAEFGDDGRLDLTVSGTRRGVFAGIMAAAGSLSERAFRVIDGCRTSRA
jgi:hypothetical protein